MKFVVHRGTDGQWYVRLTSMNNEPWLTSEGYSRKADAVRSARDLGAAILAVSPHDGFHVIVEDA